LNKNKSGIVMLQMNNKEIYLTPIGTDQNKILTVYLTQEQLDNMIYCTEYVERIRENSRKQYKNQKEREGKPPSKTYNKQTVRLPATGEDVNLVNGRDIVSTSSIPKSNIPHLQRQQSLQNNRPTLIHVYHASNTTDCDREKIQEHLDNSITEYCVECQKPFEKQNDGTWNKVAAHVIAKIHSTYNMGLITTCKDCSDGESKTKFSVTIDQFTKIYTLDYWCRKNNKIKSNITNR
jgi:hypothetical protein